jgi:hypothetical protein
MTGSFSRGKLLQETLHTQLRAIRRGFTAPDRQRAVIWDATLAGALVNGQDLDTFLALAGEILVNSRRIYKWEDTLVFEFREGAADGLLLLAVRGKPEPNAAGTLANLFCVGVEGERGAAQSVAPAKLVNALLADEGLWQKLPAIKTYARRAVFDENFVLRGPGWHPDQGVLVHGPAIVPADLPPVAPAGVGSVDRLPPHLRRLLGEFCWATEADLENALALLLTGLLANHFVTTPKPVGLIDGNQQGVGKSLLSQVTGQVLDGREPERIPLVRDEELEKKLGAKLRESKSSVILFDNVKAKLDSELVEANALSPLLSVRLLGHSRNIARPNTYLWLVTSNSTTASSDLVTRGVPVRLHHDGDPAEREFSEDVLEYATRHRLDILGELAALVLRWVGANRPRASAIWLKGQVKPRHRCQTWAETVGGILGTSGFFHFLSNLAAARADMDEGLLALATLAEHILAKNLGGFINPPEADNNRGRLPKEWAPLFSAAGVFKDKLATQSARACQTFVGTFLSGKTDRAFSISDGTNSGTAVLRRNKVRNDQKRYFEATAAHPADNAATPPGAQPGGNGHTAAPSVAPVTAPSASVSGHGPAGPNGGPQTPAGAVGPVNAQGEGEVADGMEWL